MKQLLFGLELMFLATFWWQTRINLLHYFGQWQSSNPQIDYHIPFLYLSDILFAGLLVVWALSIRDKWHWPTLRIDIVSLILNPIFWATLLLGLAAGSIILNNVGAWGWYRWVKLLQAVLVGVWVANRWSDGNRRRWYGAVLLLGLGLESLLLIGEWIKQSSLGWQWLGEWRYDIATPGVAKLEWQGHKLLRPMATFAHPNIAAGILVSSLPLAWLWMVDVRRTISKTRLWLFEIGYRTWILLVAAGIALTFSRSAWVTLVIISGLYLIYLLRRRELGWRQYTGVKIRWGAIMVVIGGLFFWPMIVGRFTSLASTDSWSLGLRWQLSDIAWQLWQTSPWLGVGLNSFTLHISTLFYGVLEWAQPVHNVWLLLLAELGLLGLLAASGLCLSLLAWPLLVVGRWKFLTSPAILVLLLTWVSVLLLSLTDHYWWTSQPGLLAVAGAAGGAWLLKKGTRKVQITPGD